MLRPVARRVPPVLVIAWLAVAAAPGSAPANPDCSAVTPALGDTVVCEYAGGGATEIAVPSRTIRIDVVVRGGGGAAGGGSTSAGYGGGSGASVEASLAPAASGVLTVAVGRGGAPKGDRMGGEGGGYSAIYEGSGASPASAIAVAGGGGGGGYGTRCTYGGAGGEGSPGPGGAGAPGSGGDAPGGGGGDGSGGIGGAVPAPLTGASGALGALWSAGGAGGMGGGTRGGDGGAGYGGGGGGGYVTSASAVTCPPGATGDPVAADDGSGGGAGGSHVKPERLLGTAAYSNSGGAGGSWMGGASSPATPGSVVLTFVGRTYTVTYDGNGATGGTAPADRWGPYPESHIVTVCDDHRTDLACDFPDDARMTRAGYSFEGWNTAADGSGTSHAPRTTFPIDADTILYAQWKALPSPPNPGAPSTPTAVTALRAAKPRAAATGATVTITAPGPGTATARGTAAQTARAGVTVCSGTTGVRRAGKAVVHCRLNATGRRLRAKGSLAVVLTTTFAAATGARLQATGRIVLPRRG